MTTLLSKQIGNSIGLSGRYRMEATDINTGKTRFLAEFDNLITNSGLDRLAMAGSNMLTHFQVGTGTNAPETVDTILGNRRAGTETNFSHSSSYSGAPHYYTTVTYSAQFLAGTATGNLSEVGIGWGNSGTNMVSAILFSRALILDGLGNPTTITITASEVLTVYYYLRYYPNLTDVTGTINISGTNYNYICRPSEVNSAGWGMLNKGLATQSSFGGYTGAIGAITGLPSGTIGYHFTGSPLSSLGALTYTNGTYYRDLDVFLQINSVNLSGGIRSISGFNAQVGNFQIQFTPNIPKDSTKTLLLRIRVSWGRRPI